MKKQIDVWEGEVLLSSRFYDDDLSIDGNRVSEITDAISDYKGKKVHVTIEVIE